MQQQQQNVRSSYREYAEQTIENLSARKTKDKYLFVDAVKDKSVEKILDLGCGAGQDILPFLEKTDAFCVGVDIAEELGQITGRFFGETDFENKYAFARAQGERLPFAENSFDVVLCRVALPYMQNRRTIAEVARVMRPGGVFLLKTHAPAFYLGMIGERAKTFSPKQLAYPLICLFAGVFHTLTGKQLEGGFWRGKEIFQTGKFIRRECARNNLRIEGFLSDTNRKTPSYVITKN